MGANHLILLMGSEAGGLYQIGVTFRRMGLPCRTPVASLREPVASRKLPAHHHLWYWNAVRRFFEDFNLPPIAPVPLDRITPEEFEYYSRLFTRSLASFLVEQSFICADHLTALVLPFLLSGMEKRGTPVDMVYCFSNPAQEAALLRQKFGQAPALSEYVWRNSGVAAILTGGKRIRFYDWGEDDFASWNLLTDEILEFFPQMQPLRSRHAAWQFPERTRFPADLPLSQPTVELYDSLRAYVKKEIEWHELEAVAQKLHVLQVEQDGWQYVNCLDCSGLRNQAKRLLNQDEYYVCGDGSQLPQDNTNAYALPDDQAGWAALVDEAERALLAARQNFERELFLQCDSLHRFYLHCLSDERKLREVDKLEEEDRRRERRIRHHRRLRALWQAKNGTADRS